MEGKSTEDIAREAQKQAEDLIWIKIVDIGESGVGKTCLVKSFCESKFSKNYTETIGVDYGFKLHSVHDKEVRVTFWDFGGSPAYVDVRRELYHQTKICLLVYDITNARSFYALDDWIQEFETFGGKGGVMFVVGNKIDLKPKRVNTTTVEEWCNRKRLKHYLTSAATGDGVQKLFNDILDHGD